MENIGYLDKRTMEILGIIKSSSVLDSDVHVQSYLKSLKVYPQTLPAVEGCL